MTAGTFTIEELIDEGVLAPPMDGNHGSIHPKTVDYVEKGIPFVMASDLAGGRVDTINCAFLSDDQANSLRKGFSKTGDVLLSHKATIGRTAIVGQLDTDFIMLTPQITYYRVLDEDRLDRRYLFYYFNSRPFQELLGQWAGAGSTRAYLGITGQRKLPIVVPEPSVQKDIVGRLGALDDKIELNRRMNETLEEMARALFRDWFVDFGPTRRQMEGATDPAAIMGQAFPPEKAATLAPLFPAKQGNDGLPEGWEPRPLDEIGQFLNGLALRKFPAQAGKPDLPVIKIAELRNGVTGKSNRASIEVPEKYVIGNGDFIFSWSGSLLAKFWTGGAGALNQHLFKVTSKSHPMWFVSEWVQTHLEEFQRIAASKAVTMGHIKRSHLTEAICICPPDENLVALGEVFDPLISKQIANDEENQTLAALRDLLLPKLMSGEIRLKDSEAGV